MWRLTFWTYFLLIALSLAPVQRVLACTCMKSHPQSLYCNSDYVAVVRVKSVETKNDVQLAYHVKVNKVFKDRNTVNPVNFPRREILWTVNADSMCGVVLNAGETYVISGMIGQGRMIHLSLCGLHMRWFEVPPRQRKGFRGLFHRGCACDVHYTRWWTKGEDLDLGGGKRCLWESEPGPYHCQETYGICLASPGGCSWAPSLRYNNCIKEHQQKREQQRLLEP